MQITRPLTVFFMVVVAGCSEGTRPLHPSVLDASVRDVVQDAGQNDAWIPDAQDAGPPDAQGLDATIPGVQPLLDSGCVASRTAASPRFEVLPSLQGPRANHGSARLPDGRVMIVGGTVGNSDTRLVPEIYDPSTNTMTVGPASPLSGPATMVLPLTDGRVFVARGFSGTEGAVYDSVTGWTRTANGPRLLSAALVALDGGTVLALGGGAPGSPDNQVQLYDPQADTWSLVARLLRPRQFASATRLADGRVLLAGGGFRTDYDSTSELFDPTDFTSMSGPDMVAGRIEPGTTLLLDRRVLLVGGSNISGAVSEIYDPSSNSFTAVRNSPGNNFDSHLVRMCDGRVAQIGGRGDRGSSKAWLFDPSVDRWQRTRATIPSRQASSATLLLDGRVLLFGGAVLGEPPVVLDTYAFVPDAPP